MSFLHTARSLELRAPSSTDRMHQALLIDEILRIIFKICAEDHYSSLSRLARCCKIWTDPALDNLWWRLPCITILLRLLPGFREKNVSPSLDTFLYCSSLPYSPDSKRSSRCGSHQHLAVLRCPSQTNKYSAQTSYRSYRSVTPSV